MTGQQRPLKTKKLYQVWLDNISTECQYILDKLMLARLPLLAYITPNASDNYRKSLTTEKEQRLDSIRRYHLNHLIYKLQQYSKNDDFDLSEPLDMSVKQTDPINQRLAEKTIQLFNTRGALSQAQRIRIKRLYYKWLRSMPEGTKCYITREKDSDIKTANRTIKPCDTDKKYNLVNINSAEDIKAKKKNLLKSLICLQGTFAIFFISIGDGLLPAVLSATPGGLFANILIIGIPSIILNYVFYNKSVKDLIKDLNKYIFSYTSIKLLIKDLFNFKSNDEGTFSKTKLLSFIVALAGGVTYSILMLETAPLAINLTLSMLCPFLPIFTVSLISLTIGYIISGYAALALTAMYFSYISELINDISDRFKQKTNNPTSNINFIQIISDGLKILLAIAGATYLSTAEAVIFYTNALNFLGINHLASIMVALGTPANFIFTVVVYLELFDCVKNLPGTINSYYNYLKTNYNNSIALYEDIKWFIKAGFLLGLNLINSKGVADGMAEEIQEPIAANILLNTVNINPANYSFQNTYRTTTYVENFFGNTGEIFGTIETPLDSLLEADKKLASDSPKL